MPSKRALRPQRGEVLPEVGEPKRDPKNVRIIPQPPNTGVRTGGFFAALTPLAQRIALQNPVRLAYGAEANEIRMRGLAGTASGGGILILPEYASASLAAHEQAHALPLSNRGAVALLTRYADDPRFRQWINQRYGRPAHGPGEVFATLMSQLATNPTAIAGWHPGGGFRQVFEPFVNRAYLWPFRPSPRITGGY